MEVNKIITEYYTRYIVGMNPQKDIELLMLWVRTMGEYPGAYGIGSFPEYLMYIVYNILQVAEPDAKKYIAIMESLRASVLEASVRIVRGIASLREVIFKHINAKTEFVDVLYPLEFSCIKHMHGVNEHVQAMMIEISAGLTYTRQIPTVVRYALGNEYVSISMQNN